MRNPTLPFSLSLLLLLAQAQSLLAGSERQEPQSTGQQQNPPTPPPQAAPAQPAPTLSSSDTAKTLLPGQFILQDATPVKLRLTRNVSSEDAHVGDSVDFEVLEDVAANGIVLIPKGSVAIATVTEAQPKRRMGRAGKLEIVLDYVRLADTEKAPVRAVKDAKGGSHTVGMTAGIVATGLPSYAFARAEEIRKAIAQKPVLSSSGSVPITMSLGLLLNQEWGRRPVEELLHEADVALYAAKAAGRNCVKLGSPDLHTADSDSQTHVPVRASR